MHHDKFRIRQQKKLNNLPVSFLNQKRNTGVHQLTSEIDITSGGVLLNHEANRQGMMTGGGPRLHKVDKFAAMNNVISIEKAKSFRLGKATKVKAQNNFFFECKKIVGGNTPMSRFNTQAGDSRLLS